MSKPSPSNSKTRISKKRGLAFRLAQGALIIYTVVFLLLMFFERSMMFPAPDLRIGNWQANRFGAEEYHVESADKTSVHVWLLANAKAKTTLIFCHGNAEHLGTLGNELVAIRNKWNVNVVAFDFRGYGMTAGSANELDILADAVSVGRWVQNNQSLKGTKVVALGRSLGGAIAIEIATKLKTDGLILDRTFSSAVDVAAAHYPIFPVRYAMQNQFQSARRIRGFEGALLQMHGDLDEVIPIKFGRKLFDVCDSSRKKFLTIRGLSHNQEWPNDIWKAGREFIESLEK